MSEQGLAIRPPAVAGMFYPGDEGTLRETVDRLLAAATARGPAPKALVVPHAGYVYSGPVAASGYARLAPLRGSASRVILLGPAHRVPLSGMAVPVADAFATPLGLVRVDVEARRTSLRCTGVVADDLPHRDEHSLEVHLPFLQRALDDIRVLPIVVGQAPTGAVADLLEALWGGSETLVIVSSDLSHYLPYAAAAGRDRRTAEAIVACDSGALDPSDACGYYPLAGLLLAASRHGLECRQLDLRNSGDTAGGRDSVVGYGAFAFMEPGAPAALSAEDRQALLGVAENSIRTALQTGRVMPEPPDPGAFSSALQAPGASFVTLERDGMLLGCRGSIEPRRPLVQDVAINAVLTAFEDPRFPPITRGDFTEMSIKLSVLTPPEPMPARSFAEAEALVRPGVDGLIVTDRNTRATFLPAVWERVAGPRDFLDRLWEKAGMTPGRWTASTLLSRYRTVEFSSPGPRAM